MSKNLNKKQDKIKDLDENIFDMIKSHKEKVTELNDSISNQYDD